MGVYLLMYMVFQMIVIEITGILLFVSRLFTKKRNDRLMNFLISIHRCDEWMEFEPWIEKDLFVSFIRWCTIRALARSGDERAVEPLKISLEDKKDEYIRYVTVLALGKIRSKKTIEPLLTPLMTEIKSFVAGLQIYLERKEMKEV